MPAIPRKTQKIYGSSLTPAGNVAVWGSTQAGAPSYSSDPAVLQAAAILSGLNASEIGNRSPVLEELNGLFLTITQQLAYLLQAGLPEWDANTTYFTDDETRVGHVTYVSKTDNNANNNPTTDTNNWTPLTSIQRGASVAAAWVEFDGINTTGGNAVIHSSFNVDHVVKNADGSYTIYFITPMNSAHYVMTGSCGSEDGQPYGSGDDGVVVGNVTGQGNAVRNATQCRVFTINSTSKALVASGDVSVIFFGA